MKIGIWSLYHNTPIDFILKQTYRLYDYNYIKRNLQATLAVEEGLVRPVRGDGAGLACFLLRASL